MEQIKAESEQKESSPKDITSEFLSMSGIEFMDFLREQRKESALSITIDWDDQKFSENTLIRLKAFLEDSGALGCGQKRSAVVRATEEQKNGPILSKSDCRNAFAFGVRWEKIENETD